MTSMLNASTTASTTSIGVNAIEDMLVMDWNAAAKANAKANAKAEANAKASTKANAKQQSPVFIFTSISFELSIDFSSNIFSSDP